jgi:fructose-1,6-bisphosphatase
MCVSPEDSSCNLETLDDQLGAVQLIEATKGVVEKFEKTLKAIRNEKKYVVENLLPKKCSVVQKEWFRAIKFELVDQVEEMHILDRHLISSIDVFGQSGLHWAVKRRNP